MQYLDSNNDVNQLGVYAGVAGVGIAAGAALAVRGTSGIYDRDRGRNRRRRDRGGRETSAPENLTASAAEERSARGTRYAPSSARKEYREIQKGTHQGLVHNTDLAHRMALSQDSVINQTRDRRPSAYDQGRKYDPSKLVTGGDTLEIGNQVTKVSDLNGTKIMSRIARRGRG